MGEGCVSSPGFQDPCDWNGLTWLIQTQFSILRSINFAIATGSPLPGNEDTFPGSLDVGIFVMMLSACHIIHLTDLLLEMVKH